MFSFLQKTGYVFRNIIAKIGRGAFFLSHICSGLPSLIMRPRLLFNQLYYVGVSTVLIVSISGLFIGMVLGLQGYYMLTDFGAEQTLGVMVATSLVRELGPVVSALLFAGRAGSSLSAEIGLMKTTEQLSGMEMMAIDPIKHIIAPRFFAGLLSMPLLSALFSMIGILGGEIVSVGLLGVDEGAFWSQMQDKIDFYDDIINGVLKSIIFGFIVTWIALFEGYTCTPTAKGISRATTRTVVNSSFSVLGLDFILTALMFGDM